MRADLVPAGLGWRFDRNIRPDPPQLLLPLLLPVAAAAVAAARPGTDFACPSCTAAGGSSSADDAEDVVGAARRHGHSLVTARWVMSAGIVASAAA